MSSTRGESRRLPKAWQDTARIQLLAVALGVLPVYASSVILYVRGDPSISTEGFILYLAVISPLAIAGALLLLRLLCGARPRDLNLKPGTLRRDLVATLALTPAILVANAVSTFVLSGWFPESASNPSVRMLFAEVAADPQLLALFLGLLLLLGAASEEVIRVFLLSRLWKVWPSAFGKLSAVAVSAGLFGLAHLYQGPVHVIWAGIFGLGLAFYYLWAGRVLPLILAHYATNAIQLIVFAARAA